MKHTIISLIALLTLSCAFVACDDDDDNAVYVNPVTPETVAAGTYEGEWERLSISDSALEVGPGYVIILSDTANVVTAQFISEQFNLDKQAVANITYAGEGFYYFNYSTTSDLGAEFAGRVDASQVNSVSFTIKQVDGRKIKEFKYSFKGTKISNETTLTDDAETGIE